MNQGISHAIGTYILSINHYNMRKKVQKLKNERNIFSIAHNTVSDILKNVILILFSYQSYILAIEEIERETWLARAR